MDYRPLTLELFLNALEKWKEHFSGEPQAEAVEKIAHMLEHIAGMVNFEAYPIHSAQKPFPYATCPLPPECQMPEEVSVAYAIAERFSSAVLITEYLAKEIKDVLFRLTVSSTWGEPSTEPLCHYMLFNLEKPKNIETNNVVELPSQEEDQSSGNPQRKSAG